MKWDTSRERCACPSNMKWDTSRERCACPSNMKWDTSKKMCVCDDGYFLNKNDECEEIPSEICANLKYNQTLEQNNDA